MKILVIGASLSGKTTIVRKFNAKTKMPILEIDDELTRLNNGTYPLDKNYKNQILVPKIIKVLLSQDNIIFFTNTDYFSHKDIKAAKAKGFKIVQLSVDLTQLQERNLRRVKNEGYQDLSVWLPGMVDYQEIILKAGLVDKVINANKSPEIVERDLMKFIKQQR